MPGRLAGGLLATAGLALAWKIMVLAGGAGAGVSVLAPLAMGVVYLACGLAARLRVPGEAARLFTVHAACQAIHWIGPPEPRHPVASAAIWFAYFIVSMLGLSALLHFTLVYPRSWIAGYSRAALRGIYLPVLAAIVIAAAWLSLPAGSPGREGLQSVFFLLESSQVTVFALAALIAIVARWLRAVAPERRRFRLGMMAAGALAAFVPWGVARIALGEETSRPLMMLFALMPVAFLAALMRPRPEGEAPSGG